MKCTCMLPLYCKGVISDVLYTCTSICICGRCQRKSNDLWYSGNTHCTCNYKHIAIVLSFTQAFCQLHVCRPHYACWQKNQWSVIWGIDSYSSIMKMPSWGGRVIMHRRECCTSTWSMRMDEIRKASMGVSRACCGSRRQRIGRIVR